jgi:hypothetical protein
MSGVTFESLNAAITGTADPASVAATAAGVSASIASMIPGQTTDYLNKQLASTLTGLAAASKLRDNAYVHGVQSTYLQGAQSRMADVVDDSTQRKDNATRQFEINEWTTNNRQETIFVYQFIFFGILAATIIGGFYRTGLLSGPLASFFTFIITAIVVFLIVYRAQYTIFKRDKRHWNKRRFQSSGAVLPLPNCPAAVDFVTNLPSNLQAVTESGLRRTAGGLSSVFGALGTSFNKAAAATGSFKF